MQKIYKNVDFSSDFLKYGTLFAHTVLHAEKSVMFNPKTRSVMKKYEMLYIIDNAVEDEQKEAIVAKFENLVKENGGTVEATDKWGTKKLAYAIDYKTEGYYVLMTFESETSFVKELDRVAGITESVLRRLITVKA